MYLAFVCFTAFVDNIYLQPCQLNLRCHPDKRKTNTLKKLEDGLMLGGAMVLKELLMHCNS